MTKIWHNPRCRKSRETLKLLEDQGEDLTIVEYLKTPPTAEELREIIHLLGIPADALIRKGEPEYQVFKNRQLSDEAWIRVMVEHPKLIERPIVIKEGKAALGRPPERILSIL